MLSIGVRSDYHSVQIADGLYRYEKSSCVLYMMPPKTTNVNLCKGEYPVPSIRVLPPRILRMSIFPASLLYLEIDSRLHTA